MRRRWPIFLGASLLGLGLIAFAGWPMVETAIGRAVEQRLRQETGQDWSIRGGASLTLRPVPQLTLNDLSTGSEGAKDGITATIRRVRLSDPLSMLTGGTNLGLFAEGVRVRAPLAETAALPSLQGLAEISAALVGAEIDHDLVEKNVTLVAESLHFALKLGTSDTTRIGLKLALPGHRLALEGEAATKAGQGSVAAPLKLTLEPRDGPGHRIEAKANAVLEPKRLRLDALSGTIDNVPLSGSLSLELAGKPRITADLSLDALTLRAAGLPQSAGSAEGVVVTLPSDVIPLPAWFEGYAAQGMLRFARLRLGPVPLESVQLKSEVKGGGLDLSVIGAAAYGGKVRGRYVVQPASGEAGRHELGLSASGLRVQSLLTDLIGARGIDGTGGLRLDLQASGNQTAALRRSVTGSAELIVKGGRLNGFDLAGLAGLVPKALGGARQIGALATRLDALTGSFTIADGRATTNDLEIRTSMLGASGIGSIDFAGQSFDLHLKPQIGNDGGSTAARRGRLDVPIRITGPWANPSISADMSKLVADPRGAIDTLQNLGTELLGERGGQLGEGLGGLLDTLIPRQDRVPTQRQGR